MYVRQPGARGCHMEKYRTPQLRKAWQPVGWSVTHTWKPMLFCMFPYVDMPRDHFGAVLSSSSFTIQRASTIKRREHNYLCHSFRLTVASVKSHWTFPPKAITDFFSLDISCHAAMCLLVCSWILCTTKTSLKKKNIPCQAHKAVSTSRESVNPRIHTITI